MAKSKLQPDIRTQFPKPASAAVATATNSYAPLDEPPTPTPNHSPHPSSSSSPSAPVTGPPTTGRDTSPTPTSTPTRTPGLTSAPAAASSPDSAPCSSQYMDTEVSEIDADSDVELVSAPAHCQEDATMGQSTHFTPVRPKRPRRAKQQKAAAAEPAATSGESDRTDSDTDTVPQRKRVHHRTAHTSAAGAGRLPAGRTGLHRRIHFPQRPGGSGSSRSNPPTSHRTHSLQQRGADATDSPH